MRQYKVRLIHKGHRYEDRISATCNIDARRLIEARYPGCNIIIVQEVNDDSH